SPRYDAAVIEPGEQAPDFELPDQEGRAVKLSDFRGQRVVLYFYPKAETPDCATQACGVRDHRAEYAREAVTVLGISPDPVGRLTVRPARRPRRQAPRRTLGLSSRRSSRAASAGRCAGGASAARDAPWRCP